MSCQEVRLLLSDYLDGEVSAAQGEMVKEHLAECEFCARELALLRSTAGMLASVGEVEPPASLLERIEAVTVNRPTLRARVRAAFEPMFRLPAYARWTAASAAAAVALLIAITSQPGLHRAMQVKPSAPPSGITAKQPSPPAETQPEVASITVTEQGIEGVRPVVRAHRRHRTVASSPDTSRKIAAKPTSPPKPAKVEPIETTEPSGVGDTAPESEAPEELNVASTATPEQPKAEIKLARTASGQADWQKKEADALADLRAKLAARNKQRKYEVREEPIQDTKYSVALGSIRF